jgi:hypothetical protein
MKWMGGWNYDDLDLCPSELIPVICEMIEEENRANEG